MDNEECEMVLFMFLKLQQNFVKVCLIQKFCTRKILEKHLSLHVFLLLSKGKDISLLSRPVIPLDSRVEVFLILFG